MFLLVALFVVGVSLLASIATFAYDRYLTHRLEVKAEELALAQRSVNQDQVEEFIRLRDRLVHGEALIEKHAAVSQFFDVLEAQTLQSVRYNTLELEVAEDQTARVDIEGTANNFNALAAQSNALATEKDIRRAIFSGIVVNQNGSVSFRLTADLDSRLVIAAPPAEDIPAMPAAPEGALPADVPAALPVAPAAPVNPTAPIAPPTP